MCIFSVQNTKSTMWPWYQKSQGSGVQSFGVASNLTGPRIQSRSNNIQQFQGESGKSSPLLRLDSVGEVTSDTEYLENSVGHQGLTMDPTRTNMESAGKYPFTHAADDQLHWFRYGNQFQQAYKMGFNPYTQPYMTQYVGPWGTPQTHGPPAIPGAQGFGPVGAWSSSQQNYPISLVYTVMGCPGYENHSAPAWNGACNQVTNINSAYPKSRMNPHAKPFTPQAMRQAASDAGNSSVQQEIRKSGAEKCVSGLSDSAENGPLSESAKKCEVSVSESMPPTTQRSDIDSISVEQMTCENREETSSKSGPCTDETIPSAATSPCESKSDVGSSEASATRMQSVPSLPEASENPMQEEFSPIVLLSSGTPEKMDNRKNVQELGRNMYILSRPRSKKKSKAVTQDRKRRRRRTENPSCGADRVVESKNHIAFILGSASSEDDSEDERRFIGNSLVISPLQCDSESGDDADWDEVDGISSAADFLTDQMCELLQPFMLSVLTIPTSLPKSASAPHLHNHSLEAVNRRWSEAYNSSGIDIKSGAKHKKQVHFAQEESESHPLQTVHPVEEYCRRGPWERFAADRCRFKSRIADVQAVINPILSASHRENVYSNRFADVS